MKSFNTMSRRWFSEHAVMAASACTVALVLSLPGMVAHAGGFEPSKEDAVCLSCHDKKDLETKLESGETLSLAISTKAYGESVHSDTSCEDCHSDLDAKTHGSTKTSIKSKRELSLAMQPACKSCHKKKVAEYDDSVHARLIKDGSTKAPLCSDCHDPHTVRAAIKGEPIAAPPCAKCHENIFKAYSGDVHGRKRVANADSAPLCVNCHQAHAVKAASSGDGVKDACLSCHENAVESHKEWLPNTARHFDAISCPVCHAPNARRRVNLMLYDSTAKRQVAEKTGVPMFEQRTDAADVKSLGLDERALWSLLKEFNNDGGDGKMVLRGRLEVSSGVEAHQLSEKSKAIKDCNICHKNGATAFQSVTLTVAGPDGRPLRHGVQKDVLTSLTAIESVRGFYAIGSTRIKLLDYLLVLVLVGAISVPLGHMTIKRLFKTMREKLEAERLAAQQQPDSPPNASDSRTDSDAST